MLRSILEKTTYRHTCRGPCNASAYLSRPTLTRDDVTTKLEHHPSSPRPDQPLTLSVIPTKAKLPLASHLGLDKNLHYIG